MKRYILAREARRDLKEILEFIAEDSAEVAARVGRRFRSVFGLLAENPAIGHTRFDLTEQPVRFFPVFTYMVVYQPDATPLQIVRVLSSARDIEAILG